MDSLLKSLSIHWIPWDLLELSLDDNSFLLFFEFLVLKTRRILRIFEQKIETVIRYPSYFTFYSKMAKRQGIGATCSVGVRYLHPKKLLKERFLSTTPKQRLSGLLSLRKESKKLNGKSQCCIVFRHDDYPNIKRFCQERWCKVDQEGLENSLFDSSKEGDGVLQEETMELHLPSEAARGAKDIMFFRAAGFDAPENIPGVEGETVPDAQTWGCHGMVSVIKSRQVWQTIQQRGMNVMMLI
jgi:hypothetical protein